MNIAIDIDDTIYVLSRRIDKLTKKYLKKYKINYWFNQDKYNIEERYYGLRLDSPYFNYMRDHSKYLYFKKLDHNIRYYLLKLASKHKLYFITNRNNSWINSAYESTYDWLIKYLNNYTDKIFLYTDVRDKGKLCKVLNCNVLIDNDIKNLIKAEGLVDHRIKITLPKAIDESFFVPNINYFYDWKSIYNFINLLEE